MEYVKSVNLFLRNKGVAELFNCTIIYRFTKMYAPL